MNLEVMQVNEAASYEPIMQVTPYIETEKHAKLMINSNSFDQSTHYESFETTAFNVPLDYFFTEERIAQTLLGRIFDRFYVETWITYCNNPLLEVTLRNTYHCHCYSDICKFNRIDSKDVDKIGVIVG